MFILLSSLLLVLFAASLSFSEGVFHAEDAPCPADLTVTEDATQALIYSSTTSDLSWNTFLYLKPDEIFQGVNVVLSSGDWRQEAWLEVNDTCFPDHTKWWWTYLEGYMKWSSNVWRITFDFSVGSCPVWCYITSHTKPGLPYSVRIMAHGPSSWRKYDPSPCNTNYDLPNLDKSPNTCKKPFITTTATTKTPAVTTAPSIRTRPTTTTTTITTTTATPTTTTTPSITTTRTRPTTTTTTITTTPRTATNTRETIAFIIAGTALFAVVVLVVLLVVLRFCIHQRGTTISPQEESTSPGSMALRENIHGRPQPPAGRQAVHEVVNDIYEPFSENIHGRPQPPAGRQAVHEVVNDIYEPFSENIYEEIDATHRPAGSGTVHEVKNDIYEPFNSGHSTQGTTGVNEHQANKESDDTYDRLDYHGAWGGTR